MITTENQSPSSAVSNTVPAAPWERWLPECLVCGSTQSDVLLDSSFHGTPEDAAKYFLSQRTTAAHGRIVRCSNCRFVYTNPQFQIEDYSKIYGAATRPTPEDNSLAVAETARFGRLSKLVRKYAGVPERLFDLGCGDGTFLSMVAAQERIGYEVAGVTTSPDSSYRIITGNLTHTVGCSPLDADSFDVVTAWDVFEHLPDLTDQISAISTLLRTNGLLLLTIPNVESIVARLSGPRWNMYLLEHLWYFSERTLTRLMEKHGFRFVAASHIPYDVPVSHLFSRIAQTYGVDFRALIKPFGKSVISLPVGLLFAAFVKE